jgi:hypothetical protein
LQQRKNTDYVLACVHAAQQAQAKLVALEAMQALMRCFDQDVDGSKVGVPTLIRCAVRLLESLVGDEISAEDPDAFTGRLCELFETGE